MAITLANTFESGQTSGTTVTNTNSGTGGNAFDNIGALGTGATRTFDSTSSRGSLSMRCTTPATATTVWIGWSTSIGTAVARCYARASFRFGALVTGTTIMRLRGAGVQCCRVTVSSTGAVELRNGANSVIASTVGTGSIGTWYRIALDVTVGASAAATLYVYNATTDTVAGETLSVTAQNFGTNNVDECAWGLVGSISNGDIRVDDVVFTDQGLPGPPSQSVSVSDSLTMADSVARVGSYPRAVAESIQLADSPARSLVLPRAVTDALTATDGVTRTVVAPRAVAESLTMADSVARAAQSFTRTAVDTLTMADSPTRTVALPRLLADTLTAGDAVSRAAMTLTRTVADALAMADSPVRQLVMARAVTDALSMADSPARTVASSRTATDALPLADQTTRVLTLARTVAESLTLADSVASGRTLTVAVAEALALTDSTARAVAAGRGVADALTLADSPARVVVYHRTTADALALADAAAVAHAQARSVVDSLGLVDVVTLRVQAVRLVFETLTLVDLCIGQDIPGALIVAARGMVVADATLVMAASSTGTGMVAASSGAALTAV